MDSNIYQITVERLYDRDLLFARGVHVKIFWHLIAPSFTPDFLGEVGLILVLGLVTFCCSHQTAFWRLQAVGWGEGP